MRLIIHVKKAKKHPLCKVNTSKHTFCQVLRCSTGPKVICHLTWVDKTLCANPPLARSEQKQQWRGGDGCEGKEIYFTQINHQLFIGSEHQHKHSSNLILPQYSPSARRISSSTLCSFKSQTAHASVRCSTRIQPPSRSILEVLLKLWTKLYTLCPQHSRAYTAGNKQLINTGAMPTLVRLQILRSTYHTYRNPGCGTILKRGHVYQKNIHTCHVFLHIPVCSLLFFDRRVKSWFMLAALTRY